MKQLIIEGLLALVAVLTAFALLAVLLTPPAHAQGHSKCKTRTGEIIIVAGNQCPRGTIFIGVA